MKSLILIFLFSLASFGQQFTVPLVRMNASGLALSPGWQWITDGFVCDNPGADSCTLSQTGVVPLVPGAISLFAVITGNTNVHISSITGTTGGTWVYSSTSGAHEYNSGNDAVDVAYNLGLTSGPTSSTVITMSGDTSSSYFDVFWIQIIPPSGYSASFDTTAGYGTTSCTTCTGSNLTLTGTDAVLHVLDSTNLGTGSTPQLAWNACSGAYVFDGESCEEMNATSGTAPSVTFTSSQSYFSDVAIAFKSTAGSFTPPTPVFSITSLTWTPNSNVNCSPGCGTITIPSTAAGDLVFVSTAAASGDYLASGSVGGTALTVPSGTNSCRLSAGSYESSCGYAVATGSATSVSLTASGSVSMGYQIWDVHRTTGSFSLDNSASSTESASSGIAYNPTISLSGTNDVEFNIITCNGGMGGWTYFPQPFYPVTGPGYFYSDDASGFIGLNTTLGGGNSYAANQCSTSGAAIVAFK